MFERRGDKMVCSIHPDVQAARGVAKIGRKHRLVESCPACDQLVEELKQLKSPEDRFWADGRYK